MILLKKYLTYGMLCIFVTALVRSLLKIDKVVVLHVVKILTLNLLILKKQFQIIYLNALQSEEIDDMHGIIYRHKTEF